MPGSTEHEDLGPWAGLDETGTGGPHKVVAALNVVFENGVVRRRPGRARILGGAGDTAVRGIFQLVTASGERRVLTVSDPRSWETTARIGLFDAYNQATGQLQPIAVPADLQTTPGVRPVAAAWRDSLILSFATDGQLASFDGDTIAVLGAMQGMDAVEAVPGADAYLSSPPRATLLETWRGRVVAIADPLARRLVGLSLEDSDFAKIPGGAPLGGANVWPARTNFSVLTTQGDEIVASAIVSDQLVLLTRRSIVVVTEDAISPIARVRETQNGCVAAGSLQSLGSRLVYLSDGRICVWEGGEAREVSAPVSRTLEELVNWKAAAGAVSVHLAKRNEYRIWLPILGETRNQLCIIWQYTKGDAGWRIYCGHFPFASSDERSANWYDVTAAAAVITGANEEILLTGDSDGGIWIEDAGEADTTDFPAYIALPQLGDGQAIFDWRNWIADVLYDGQAISMFALRDGEPLEAALLDFDGTDSDSSATKIARLEGHHTFDTVLAWPLTQHDARWARLRFDFQGKASRLRPVIVWPTIVPGFSAARGGIRALELELDRHQGRRG